MIQAAENAEKISINVRDVMAMTGTCKTAARSLLTNLEALGLKRKGAGRGTMYDRREFLEIWGKLDTRP